MDAKVKGVKVAAGDQAPAQRIARLTPLGDALAALARLANPVAPRTVDAADAVNRILAADVAAGPLPPRPVALVDGFAVRAEEIAGASSYAPIPLPNAPPRVEAGDVLPAATDSVVPLELIVMHRAGAEAVGAVPPGEGVLRAAGDANPAIPLRRAGERVRATDAAVFAAAGVAKVSVRVPRLRIVAAREDLRLQPSLQMIARDCAAQGAEAVVRNGIDLEQALQGADDDALIIIGGTGAGARDVTVVALEKAGHVAVHGIGLSPGETAALGSAGPRPVLAIPGRLDAALAVWLVLGRVLLARLGGSNEEEQTVSLALSCKITSTVGIAEFVPVRRDGDSAEPLAAGHLPLSSLAGADGWLLVPPQSEGHAAGTRVATRAWPK